jgi:hypothetical protein
MADDIVQKTIADEGARLSAVIARDAFGGCAKRTDVAAFLVTFAAEQRARGMLLGVAAGICGSAALYFYLRSKKGSK